jgi:hypothetical protein
MNHLFERTGGELVRPRGIAVSEEVTRLLQMAAGGGDGCETGFVQQSRTRFFGTKVGSFVHGKARSNAEKQGCAARRRGQKARGLVKARDKAVVLRTKGCEVMASCAAWHFETEG